MTALNSVQKLVALANQLRDVNKCEFMALEQLRAIEQSRSEVLKAYSEAAQKVLIVISGCDAMKKEIIEATQAVTQGGFTSE